MHFDVPKIVRSTGCFPKCLGTRTLYLGQRGKPMRFLESTKGSFAESRARRQGSRCLAPGLHKTSFGAFKKPRGLSPLAQIKCSCAQTFRETSGTPSDGFWNLSGDQTLLSTYQYLLPDHSGVPRHIRDLIQNSEQHSVTNIHNSYNTISSTNVKRADPTGSRTM